MILWIIWHYLQTTAVLKLMGTCSVSSAYTDIPGSRDVFHSDEKTGSQAAHPAGTDGTEGWRTAWRTEPKPETGESQVQRANLYSILLFFHVL